MKKRLKNSEMLIYLKSLKLLLALRDKIGYVAVQDYRFLSNSTVEFDTICLGLIEKYGEKGKDERGAPTYMLKTNSPNFQQSCDELVPFNEMGHEAKLMMAKYDDAAGSLPGKEILAIDWMLEDQEGVS